MAKEYCWMHAESDTVGWCETEEALELMLDNCLVDHIPEELFNQKVAEGYSVGEPAGIWIVDEATRKQAFEHIGELEAKLGSLKAIVQNKGVCIKASHPIMLGLTENIKDGVDGFVNTVVRNVREVK